MAPPLPACSLAPPLPVQFTLCHVLKGNKPDFHDAMAADASGPMYQDFLSLLGSMHRPEAIKGEGKRHSLAGVR